MTRSASSGHKWIDTLQYHNSLDLVEMLHTHTHVQNEMEKQSNSVIDHWLVLLHCTRRNILLVVTGLEIQATDSMDKDKQCWVFLPVFVQTRTVKKKTKSNSRELLPSA
jgi:hypothetical protein